MNYIHPAVFLAMLSVATMLGGCASVDTRSSEGASVRSIVARQIANPQPARPPAMIDGATAVEIVKNYMGSYDNPRPQPAGSAFGR